MISKNYLIYKDKYESVYLDISVDDMFINQYNKNKELTMHFTISVNESETCELEIRYSLKTKEFFNDDTGETYNGDLLASELFNKLTSNYYFNKNNKEKIKNFLHFICNKKTLLSNKDLKDIKKETYLFFFKGAKAELERFEIDTFKIECLINEVYDI